jgi:hypothetical protein
MRNKKGKEAEEEAKKKKKGTVKRNTESASLQAIASRAAEIPISKGPHSPLKQCAFVRVSER